jgi:hypothetical protein
MAERPSGHRGRVASRCEDLALLAAGGFSNVTIEWVRIGSFGGNHCFGLRSNLRGGLPPVK